MPRAGRTSGSITAEASPPSASPQNFCRDLFRVCGCRAALTRDAQRAAFLIGVFGEDAVTDALAGEDADALRGEDGALRWEGYLHKLLPDGRLLIAGNGRRGAIFGVYDLSRRFGVSPWYFFADVPVRTREEIALPAHYKKADWPCVQYRGIFLNDEEELEAWAKLHTDDGTIGPKTYRLVFELILRLKGNYIWPAMHVNAFNADPENGRLAEEMGIVVGTSHCDMLLRSNQHEFDPWVRKKGYEGLLYDYSMEENRPRLQEYWRESVEQNAGYEVCYTVGMRGIHDTGFCTRAIDGDPALSEEEKVRARVGAAVRQGRVLHLQLAVPVGLAAADGARHPRGGARLYALRRQIGIADRPHLSHPREGTDFLKIENKKDRAPLRLTRVGGSGTHLPYWQDHYTMKCAEKSNGLQ